MCCLVGEAVSPKGWGHLTLTLYIWGVSARHNAPRRLLNALEIPPEKRGEMNEAQTSGASWLLGWLQRSLARDFHDLWPDLGDLAFDLAGLEGAA